MKLRAQQTQSRNARARLRPPFRSSGGIASAVNPPGVQRTRAGRGRLRSPVLRTGSPSGTRDTKRAAAGELRRIGRPVLPGTQGALPDETAPVSFPDNYPDEGFLLPSPTPAAPASRAATAVRLRLVIALEQN